MDAIKFVENELSPVSELPSFKSGDTITVYYKIKEGNKERIQNYRGVVIQRKGTGSTATFTVRKTTAGIGIERIFPIYSQSIESIEVLKRGRVRRAKLYYLRDRQGKAARIKELR